MKADIHQRAKTLSNACLKMALLISNDHALSPVIRAAMIDNSSQLAIRSKMLMTPMASSYFLKTLFRTKECADSLSYWLEMVLTEKLMDVTIAKPIFEESVVLGNFLSQAMIKVKDRID